MNDGQTFKVMTISELSAEVDRREALPVTHPQHPRGFEWDAEAEGWCIWWGGYEYFVEHSRIETPEQLLGWIVHIGTKTWKDATAPRLARWARAVANRNRWEIY